MDKIDRRIVVFISAPYSKGDTAANIRRSMSFSKELIELGFSPLNPLLCHYMDIMYPQSYEIWFDVLKSQMMLCDAVLRIPGESSGADKEVEIAKKIGKPIVKSIPELIEIFFSKEKRRKIDPSSAV